MDIGASPESVSDVLEDIDAAPLWTSGLEHLELVEGVPGQPGCVGLAHYVEGSRRYTLEDHLLEAVPGRHYKSRIEGGGLKITVETTLERVGDATRMTLRWSGRGTNPLTKLMLPFMGNKVRERSLEDLESLRKLVEARRTQRPRSA
jgi:hypothetical protein